MAKTKATSVNTGVVAENRKARFNYELGDTFEAGIELHGTEVKSLRVGKANIADSYASPEGSEMFLINGFIPEYTQANRFNHEERRPRKLLLKKREIGQMIKAVERDGMTIVPLKLYFNDRGLAKLTLALGKGKRQVDKRQTEKKRDWDKQKARLLREKG